MNIYDILKVQDDITWKAFLAVYFLLRIMIIFIQLLFLLERDSYSREVYPTMRLTELVIIYSNTKQDIKTS